jgi:hypothetical protein
LGGLGGLAGLGLERLGDDLDRGRDDRHGLEARLLQGVPDLNAKTEKVVFVVRGKNFDLDIEAAKRNEQRKDLRRAGANLISSPVSEMSGL